MYSTYGVSGPVVGSTGPHTSLSWLVDHAIGAIKIGDMNLKINILKLKEIVSVPERLLDTCSFGPWNAFVNIVYKWNRKK